ncbi:hypothetical protein K505DRAFT_301013 [Melanomma pulvis-pyrius CBS 109.77]|uniref:Zn(2)-C6 fungal-type domain-containing protein n=1 Tax=Melanomma pulvis-pyrius CBS 109.77 TaxID=1314802 RepID=A0A6A6XHN8_9PLEO|nr:hypothetical protein K505DRAFT_301013 [Melanomma pulvis-pyrius CBS 109.77]
MNFVDVQPKSFLDYAWTTPSPAMNNAAKSSKTSRKQNRCCDQCRKGKRACDAAILEDTLLDNNGTCANNPTVFHYSDVFGPLAPCANCEKTKKKCTFEWLRSQRVLQAAPQSSTAPPTKRRRTQSGSSNGSQNQSDTISQLRATGAPHPVAPNTATTNGGHFATRSELVDLGLTFADLPGIPAFGLDASPPFPYDSVLTMPTGLFPGMNEGAGIMTSSWDAEDGPPLDRDSGQGSSLDTSSEGIDGSPEDESLCDSDSIAIGNQNDLPRHSGAVMRIPRKRRRRSSSGTASSVGALYKKSSVETDFFSSTSNVFLAESLLKIYHDSFENALTCWLTERTCPYSKGSELSLANDSGPDWNRIYHRVFRLDRLASPIRGRHLTCSENQAATRAINMAIFSFSTQWAQSSPRSKAKYPFHNDGSDDSSNIFDSNGDVETPSASTDFDRTLQISAWHEANAALKNAAEIESFRVVLAQIVFSMTQRPVDMPEESTEEPEELSGQLSDSPTRMEEDYSASTPSQSENTGVGECEDLMSKLDLTIEGDGPPTHLEQGLRLIHSLRSRMKLRGTVNKPSSRCAKQSRQSPNRLDATDRATVDLLFWLGIMFDTLSSAMHKRPLVVSDEDSDIYANEPRPTINGARNRELLQKTALSSTNKTDGLWDDYLFARQRKRVQGVTIRWPCSYEQAASLLCDAAPVKVLLFRKVTRIQTLLSRNAHGETLERAIKAALDVYDHWGKLYAPFIRDCTENHDSLPPRVQAWYICLTGHWHLATLLLADLLEIIDGSELSAEPQRHARISTDFVARFRETNCHGLSDLARCASPRENASFPTSRDFHFAVNEGALMTEPWTAVMIRAFAKAGVVLLETEASFPSDISESLHQEDNFRRANDCVKALWYLGRKSDMARSAAKILGEALKERRKGAEEKINDMSSFLEAELWEGFEQMSGAFETECL